MTKEKSMKLHRCSKCDNTSTKSSTFEGHLKTFSGAKCNECNQCNYSSVKAGDLRRHMKIHSGEKSHTCNQCNYKTVRACNLGKHLKIHSGEKTNVTLHVWMQAIWGNIWKLTQEKNRTDATNVIMHLCTYASGNEYDLRSHTGWFF